MARRKSGPSKTLKRRKTSTALRRANELRQNGAAAGGLSSLRNEFTELTRHLEGLATDSGGAALEQLRGRLDSIASSVDGVVNTVSRRGRQAAGVVNDFRGGMVDTIEDAVRSRPLTTVALALGVGFALASSIRR
ncbi:MAG: hypothetical protein JOZ70_08365 [Pseudolabrys sp.]|nr:hypothetical protein [Pseudolabrys sp.]MBV9955251.1 hypothetical protein [Pseudolabrys sp.]